MSDTLYSNFVAWLSHCPLAWHRIAPCIRASENATFIEQFSGILMKTLLGPFSTVPSSCRSQQKKIEKIWSEFHMLRISSLPRLWNSCFSTLGIPSVDPLVIQSLNQILFEDLLRENIGACIPQVASTRISSLSKDEENALRYAAGYVPYRLLRRYEKSSNEKSQQFVECLGNMAVAGSETGLLDYTKEWIERINRGGLFPINDETFQFFCILEACVRSQLVKALLPSTSETRLTVISTAMENEEVLFHWSMIAVDIDEEHTNELLQEIVMLWVTIRGFAVAASWLEHYKEEARTTTKKSRGLRKKLSQREPDNEGF